MSCHCQSSVPYKSVVWALILAILLGPIGLLYTSWRWSLFGLVLMVVAVAAGKWAAFTFPFLWLFFIYLNVIYVERYNRKLLGLVSRQAEGCAASC